MKLTNVSGRLTEPEESIGDETENCFLRLSLIVLDYCTPQLWVGRLCKNIAYYDEYNLLGKINKYLNAFYTVNKFKIIFQNLCQHEHKYSMCLVTWNMWCVKYFTLRLCKIYFLSSKIDCSCSLMELLFETSHNNNWVIGVTMKV